MEFGADAVIDHVGQCSTIEHAHVILVLEALDLGARHTLRQCLVPHVHQVIHPMDGLGCIAHGEQVHFKAQANKLDYWIHFGLVFEVAHFSGVKISVTTFEVRKVAITNLAKIKGDSTVKSRVYFFSQVFHKEVKEE